MSPDAGRPAVSANHSRCSIALHQFLDRAYHGLVIPLLGFFFLPITTIVYAWMVNSGLPMQGFNPVILIFAVLPRCRLAQRRAPGTTGDGYIVIRGRCRAYCADEIHEVQSIFVRQFVLDLCERVFEYQPRTIEHMVSLFSREPAPG